MCCASMICAVLSLLNTLFFMQVVLPMLCSYMSHWWEYGPENNLESSDRCCTSLRWEHMNALLGNILKIIYNNLGIDEGTWMKRLAGNMLPWSDKMTHIRSDPHFFRSDISQNQIRQYDSRSDRMVLGQIRQL